MFELNILGSFTSAWRIITEKINNENSKYFFVFITISLSFLKANEMKEYIRTFKNDF